MRAPISSAMVWDASREMGMEPAGVEWRISDAPVPYETAVAGGGGGGAAVPRGRRVAHQRGAGALGDRGGGEGGADRRDPRGRRPRPGLVAGAPAALYGRDQRPAAGFARPPASAGTPHRPR